MNNYFCEQCGTALSEEQKFCPKCGMKKEEEITCDSCGNILSNGADFCPKCGAKVGAVGNKGLNLAIDSFNASINEKKAKSKKKKYFVTGAVALVVAALFLFIFRDSIVPFTGTYKCVSAGSSTTYTFAKDDYLCETSDDSYTADYTKDGKSLILFNKDGDKDYYNLKGRYMYKAKEKFDQELVLTNNVADQTLSHTTPFNYKPIDLSVYNTLVLKPDGTYKHTIAIGSNDVYTTTETGKYTVKKGVLTLNSDENDNTWKYVIVNNNVYYSVFEKQ